MRLMLYAEIDTPTGNQRIVEGRMSEVMDGLVGRLAPEAAYFYERHGRRAFTLVVEAPDSSSLPSLVEPIWLELGAHVEVIPCMTADELREGLGRLG